MPNEMDSQIEESGSEPVVETSFGTVTGRLSEIADAMGDESLSLDDALDLLEEAVSLGMKASTLLESDMNERYAQSDGAENSEEDEVDQDAQAVLGASAPAEGEIALDGNAL